MIARAQEGECDVIGALILDREDENGAAVGSPAPGEAPGERNRVAA